MFPEPSSYKDIVLDPQVATLLDYIVTNHIQFPGTKNGLILYGPYGTGKTTLADLLPKDLSIHRGGGPKPAPTRHAICAGNNGSQVLQSMSNAASLYPVDGNHHYFILDEVDNLTEVAMKSLKVTMDVDKECTIFIMTTNNLTAIDRAVISRSHLIDMTTPPASAWVPKIQQALSSAGITKAIASASIQKIVELCNGDAREIIVQAQKLAIELRP